MPQQRRTRTVAPRLVEDAELPQDTPPGEEAGDTAPAPVRKAANGRRASSRTAQARRLQAATSDPKVRLPEGERAVEVADGQLAAPIGGKLFRLSDSIGLMPLMEWAASNDEVDTQNVTQLVTFFRVLQDLVHEDAWTEFRAFTREAKCTDKDFVDFQNAAMEAIAARPTPEPAGS
jgi:hypothetical protein